MWFRGLLPGWHSPPPIANLASAKAEVPARVPPAAVPHRIADEDATQPSAGVQAPPSSQSEEAEAEDVTTSSAERERDLPTEPADLPQPGAIVGGTYRVVSEIGRGSMGVVLSAFDQKLERTVAIKLIRAELLDSGFRRRFMRSEEHTSELQSQSKLVCRLLLEKKNPCLTTAPLCLFPCRPPPRPTLFP